MGIFIREFLLFIRVRKKYWLVPIFMVTFLVAILLVLAKSSAIAPFIYTLF